MRCDRRTGDGLRVLPIGTSGVPTAFDSVTWSSIGLSSTLTAAARLISGSETVRPVQLKAAEAGVFYSRRNVLVSSPTNSGKTLVGLLVLCEALARGQRTVLLEPLRALAQEKSDDLRALQRQLSKVLGVPVKVAVSTGDYRLEGETFSDPAPGAELIIATPERLESILRSPENLAWFEGLGAVCVDEAHLVSDPHRGATLEYLITSLLTLPNPPRLALLSATISGEGELANWLRPCDVIAVKERTPPLEKWLGELDVGEDPNESVAGWLKEELNDQKSQALVFIHQARQTASTAAKLTESLGVLAGRAGALAYNSQMSPAQRGRVRAQFVSGECRVVVATSALAMGVNLPATHTVVRDLTYIGTRSPGIGEILQMVGRAGRGNQAGKSLVVKRTTDRWESDELREGLRLEVLPPLRSAFLAPNHSALRTLQPPVVEVIASMLLRSGEVGKSLLDAQAFFEHSLGGNAIATLVPESLKWLHKELLAFEEESTNKFKLTRLGDAIVRGNLPLKVGARFGQLLRDLVTLEEDKETLGRWTPLDFLIILELLHEGTPSLRRFSADLAIQVTAWCEAHPTKVPMFFRKWLRGEKGFSTASEVMGSMGIEPADKVADLDEWARQRGYLAVFNAIVIFERSQGKSAVDLERQFGISNLEGVEERWRDTMIWLLGGLVRCLDIKCFYFHLKESCEAGDDRIKSVKLQLGAMRRALFELIEQIKYASPLGGIVLTMRRRGRSGVGSETIRKLEAIGVTRMDQIATLSEDDLVESGVGRNIAKKLLSHVRAARA